ncbi:hypothetical protein ADIS_3150 [Lunatimonas lonarensis]|uniref:Uncharacterized protein n=1 Tax=Lunatimonas lonarensis TaxID=1232681 RepID=R7ZRE8_9BACT|nr:hypothetical protein [Lunatimonas lonarensis]EON76700.1 hypothetical protein ADIS_3150 [Lunatimonas lonarensis]
MNQFLWAECFEMDGGLLGNQWIAPPMAACGPALTQSGVLWEGDGELGITTAALKI